MAVISCMVLVSYVLLARKSLRMEFLLVTVVFLSFWNLASPDLITQEPFFGPHLKLILGQCGRNSRNTPGQIRSTGEVCE